MSEACVCNMAFVEVVICTLGDEGGGGGGSTCNEDGGARDKSSGNGVHNVTHCDECINDIPITRMR